MIESNAPGLAFHDRLSKIILFNESGDKWLSRRKLIGGSKTNIMTLAAVKYQWAMDSYRSMFLNIFNPMQFNLSRENRDYASLSDLERKAYDRLMSSLIFLTSLQLSNVQNMAPYFTAPEITMMFTMMEFQLELHLDSYSQILISTVPESHRESIYEGWRTNDQIRQRNFKINERFATFAREPFADNLMRNLAMTVLVYNVSLMTELAPIYALSRHSKMMGISGAVKYGQRDITSHTSAIIKLYNSIVEENPSLGSADLKTSIHSTIREYVQMETDLLHYVCEGMIPGLSDVALARFSQSLANKTSKGIGYELLFPGITMSPIPWFDTYGEIKR
ncbi:MAG: ribonucleotide-diphosphate reductase subunit beta [Candidatus Thermoplasmatota archaeon]|nr:ribonucleotide-diphosphate reductase subunit beta [Candidatus Thermoplasmatota archaeon]